MSLITGHWAVAPEPAHQLTGERGQEGEQMVLLHDLNLDDHLPREQGEVFVQLVRMARVWPQVSHSSSPRVWHWVPTGMGTAWL